MNTRLSGWMVIAAAWLAPGGLSQIDAFAWDLAGNTAGSGVQSPGALSVVGPDSSGCSPPATWFETVFPVGGSLSVAVEFQNLDAYVHKGQAWYDAPAWVIDGVWQSPPQTGEYPPGPKGWPTGSYVFELEVEAGQRVGLGVWSADCAYGPGVADFHDLVFVPKPWSVHPAALDPRVAWTSDTASFGPDIAAAGDVDQDGVTDIVQGGSSAWPLPEVRILSGVDGAMLLGAAWTLSSPRTVAGVGDVDGDGVPDVAVGDATKSGGIGLGFAGAFAVLSGADGATLLQVQGASEWDELGDRLAGVGDVDLDGVPDVAARLVRPFKTKSQVRLYSGATGAVLETLSPALNSNSFGIGLAGPGDATGDGVPDVLVGTPGDSSGVTLHSGATGGLAKTFAKPAGAGDFGQSVAAAGDLDGGGTTDVLVGAPYDHGSVFAFSVETTMLLSSITGPIPGGLLGSAVSGAGDVDGDGRLDLAAGAPGEKPGGSVRVLDALDGTPKATFAGVALLEQFGGDVVMAGDFDGDGQADVAGLSAPSDIQGASLVRAWSRLAHPGPPALSGVGVLFPDQLATATIANALPSTPGFLVLGTSLLDAPLAGGVLAPSPDALIPVLAGPDGTAAVSGRWPAGLPVWTSIWMQAWMADPDGPDGFSATDAVAASQL